jgi:hypothetical protein
MLRKKLKALDRSGAPKYDLAQLQEEAKGLLLQGTTGLSRDELIQKILEAERASDVSRMRRVLNEIRDFQESTQTNLEKEYKDWEKMTSYFTKRVRPSVASLVTAHRTVEKRDDLLDDLEWLLAELYETERQQIPQFLQWMLDELHERKQLPKCCHKFMRRPKIPMAGKKGHGLRSSVGLANMDEEQLKYQLKVQKDNRLRSEAGGGKVKAVIGAILVVYSIVVTVYVVGKLDYCCGIPGSGEPWITKNAGNFTVDQSMNGSQLCAVTNPAAGTSVCTTGSPHSRCSFTCAKRACGEDGPWFVPTQVLRRPNQGRTYVDEYVCIKSSDYENIDFDANELVQWAPGTNAHSAKELKFRRHQALSCEAPNVAHIDATSICATDDPRCEPDFMKWTVPGFSNASCTSHGTSWDKKKSCWTDSACGASDSLKQLLEAPNKGLLTTAVLPQYAVSSTLCGYSTLCPHKCEEVPCIAFVWERKYHGSIEPNEQIWYLLNDTKPDLQYTLVVSANTSDVWLQDTVMCIYRDNEKSPSDMQLLTMEAALKEDMNSTKPGAAICNDNVGPDVVKHLRQILHVKEDEAKSFTSHLTGQGDSRGWYITVYGKNPARRGQFDFTILASACDDNCQDTSAACTQHIDVSQPKWNGTNDTVVACSDDPNGTIAQYGMTCAIVEAQVGCGSQWNGSNVSGLCPVVCNGHCGVDGGHIRGMPPAPKKPVSTFWAWVLLCVWILGPIFVYAMYRIEKDRLLIDGCIRRMQRRQLETKEYPSFESLAVEPIDDFTRNPLEPNEIPLKMHNAKIKGKKLQLQVADTGLLVFEQGALRDTYAYQFLLAWNENRKGMELETIDGKNINIVCNDAGLVCSLMTEKATALAQSMSAPRRNTKAMPSPAPFTQTSDTKYDAKVKGKKVQLYVDDTGLMIFDRNTLRDTYIYQSLLAWNENTKGIELDTADGKSITIVCSDAALICSLMTEKATALASLMPCKILHGTL